MKTFSLATISRCQFPSINVFIVTDPLSSSDSKFDKSISQYETKTV